MLLKFCKYNVWANQKIIDYTFSAGEAIADRELISSFSTIRKTLYHLWDAQVIWYNRLQEAQISSWPSAEFRGSITEACNGIIINSEEVVSLVRQFNGDYSKNIIYKNLEGKEYSNSAADIILHCMNHGTYHRGQIITMLRQAGIKELGSTDFIRFCREDSKSAR